MKHRDGVEARDWGGYVYYTLSVTLLALIVLVLVSCQSAYAADKRKPRGKSKGGEQSMQLSVGENELLVATYNVLNFFDTEYDSGKQDFTFLPSGTPVTYNGVTKKKEDWCRETMSPGYYQTECLQVNWTREHFELKTRQTAKAIRAIGDLPDLLGVQEIENENAVRALAAELGYGTNFLVSDSPDHRGIDVALLYRDRQLERIEEENYEIVLQGEGFPPSFNSKPTRNILRVHFRIKGHPEKMLAVYVNHWPSQASGPDKRMAVAHALRADIEKETARYGRENYYAILLGDFNTLPWEKPNAFHNVIQAPEWDLGFVDAQDISNLANAQFNKRMPPFSYYYYGSKMWEKLDRILFSRNFDDNKGIEFLPKTFRIVSDAFLMKPFPVNEEGSFFHGSLFAKVSRGYDFKTLEPEEAGFSDHLPVAIKVALE